MSKYLTSQQNIEENNKKFDFSDEENLNLDENVNLSVTIPKNERKLHTQAYDKSINDLMFKIEEKDIILNPQYQRNYVWDNGKASLLIESILLNVPIPIVYMAEDEEERWNIVDGLQRLNSLHRFFKDKFKLSRLEVLQELNGKKYSQLDSKAQRIIKNGIIRIVVISKESHHEIKYDIFMRLNRGSIKLNEQELRNCLYRGMLNNLLKNKLRKNKNFLAMVGITAPHKRLIDVEIILRYLAISEKYNREKGEVKDYSGDIKVFLNAYMNKHQNPTDSFIESIEKKFENTIDKVYMVFGEKAFQKINQEGNTEKRLNRAIHDCLMISFENEEQEYVIEKKEKIIEGLKNLIKKDQRFYDSISAWTSDKNKLNYRLKTWNEELQKILSN